MADIVNPHDRFFREVLSHREAAPDFVRHYLPAPVVAALDLETLELTRDSFVDPELRAHFSDLVYRVDLVGGEDAYVYLSRPSSQWSSTTAAPSGRWRASSRH